MVWWLAAGWFFVASYVILGLALLLEGLFRSSLRRLPLLISLLVYVVPMVIVDIVEHCGIEPYWPEILVHCIPLLLAPGLAFVSKATAFLI